MYSPSTSATADISPVAPSSPGAKLTVCLTGAGACACLNVTEYSSVASPPTPASTDLTFTVAFTVLFINDSKIIFGSVVFSGAPDFAKKSSMI